MVHVVKDIFFGCLHPYIPENSKSAMVISFSYVILFNKKDYEV